MTLQKDGFKFLGLHVSPFNEITFVTISQKGELYSMAAKTSNYPLLKFLEFIFTLWTSEKFLRDWFVSSFALIIIISVGLLKRNAA